MNLLSLTSAVVSVGRILTRTVVWATLFTVVFAVPQFAWAKAPAHHRAAHRGSHHHHRGGYHRVGYARHRGYGGNYQQAWMARMYQQQYQTMMKQRQAEAKAFMATFDANHNGTIEGKERGPAEHYLRERRLGKVPALSITGKTRVKG